MYPWDSITELGQQRDEAFSDIILQLLGPSVTETSTAQYNLKHTTTILLTTIIGIF